MTDDRPALVRFIGGGEVLDRLARRLHVTMERLDPTNDPVKSVIAGLAEIYEFQQ
jgi:hypothetical protein